MTDQQRDFLIRELWIKYIPAKPVESPERKEKERFSMVKITIESDGKKTYIEGDVLIFGIANIDYQAEGYPRVCVNGGLHGKGDLLSVHRIYTALAQSVHEQSIKEIYGVSCEEAGEIVRDITPKKEKE